MLTHELRQAWSWLSFDVRQKIKYISAIVLSVLILPFVASVFAVKWEGEMRTPGVTQIIHLPDTPLWTTPTKPKFSDFTYEHIEVKENENLHTITIHRRLGDTIFTAATYLWPITAAFSVLHFLIRKWIRSRALLLCVDLFIGISLSLLLCFALYALMGGWGPPFQEFFLATGIALGSSVFLLFHTYTKEDEA